MIFVELHDKNGEPFKVNPNAILFYKPYGEHLCALTMYCGSDSVNVIVKENYQELNHIMQHFEMMNEDDTLSLYIGIQQYLDFLNHTKQNPLRDEYLKWKGRHKLVSGKQWIDADELLIRMKPDKRARDLIKSLIVKDDENESNG